MCDLCEFVVTDVGFKEYFLSLVSGCRSHLMMDLLPRRCACVGCNRESGIKLAGATKPPRLNIITQILHVVIII